MAELGRGRVTRFQTIQEVLNILCHEHGLEAAVLADEEGLPLSTSTASSVHNAAGHHAATYEADTLAAATAQLRRAARQAERQLSWSQVDEVSAVAPSGSRLVGRCLLVGNNALILVVVVPGRTAYRRATNWAIRSIRQAWEDR